MNLEVTNIDIVQDVEINSTLSSEKPLDIENYLLLYLFFIAAPDAFDTG